MAKGPNYKRKSKGLGIAVDSANENLEAKKKKKQQKILKSSTGKSEGGGH
jgi:hypothetical protein